MDAIRQVNSQALTKLKAYRTRLTPQQYGVLRGQILAGDDEGALKGLRKLLRREKERTNDHTTRQGAGHCSRK